MAQVSKHHPIQATAWYRVPVGAALLALLIGCATQPEYRVVDIPEPPVVNRPELPVLTITKDMDPGTIIQLHRETIKRLQAWGLELEAALNAYRKDIK